MKLEEQFDRLKARGDYADMAKLAALEDELQEARREAGLPEKRNRLFRFIDSGFEKQGKRSVNKKTYLKLLFSCGWLTGAHRFYAGQKITGALYLLFFWTGIPFAMCLFDFMGVFPKQADEKGYVVL